MSVFYLSNNNSCNHFRPRNEPWSSIFSTYKKFKRRYNVKKVLLWILVVAALILLRELYSYISPSAALSRIKSDVEKEYINFNYSSLSNRVHVTSLQDLTPETGGKPIINVIITNFRSGSTFLGQTLNSFPGSYFHYEPLLHFGGLVRISDEHKGFRAVNDLRKMLNCDFSGLVDFISEAKNQRYPLTYNKRVINRFLLSQSYDWEFLSNACQLFPIQSMKVTRLALKFAKGLLDDDSLNLKIIYLVRDPRGILRSRWDLPWGNEQTDYYTAEGLCSAMVDDYHAAKELISNYPNKFTVLRYEDFSATPFYSSMDLFKFLGLPFHKNVAEYVDTHTKGYKKNFWVDPSFATFRDTSATMFRWKKSLTYEQVADIQEKCHDALEMWGYKEAQNQYELETNFNPVYQYNKNLEIVRKSFG